MLLSCKKSLKNSKNFGALKREAFGASQSKIMIALENCQNHQKNLDFIWELENTTYFLKFFEF